MNTLKEYLKATYKSWIAIFSTTIGFGASIILFIPEVSLNTTYSKIIALLFCIILSVVITLITKPVKYVIENFNVDDLVLDINTSTKILFPYQEKYLKPINIIANSYYGDRNPDLTILKQWYGRNPYTLITLVDKYNTILGYYDILPLEDNFAKDFIAGRVTEEDIRSRHILTPKQMRNAKYLYFAGVAIKDYTKQRNKIYSGQLIYSAYIYLNNFYDLDREIIMFAIAATNCGEKLLKGLDYSLESSRHNRKDKTDLYLKKVTKQTIEKDRNDLALITNKIDYSEIIKACKINDIKATQPQKRKQRFLVI